jgi:uncharacterized protein (UPF0264 family)
VTGLLISVRDAAEAEIALAGGSDFVDVKEPLRGALGSADPRVWQGVLRIVGGRVPTSAALGELLDDSTYKCIAQCRGFTYAKLGLAGCGRMRDWRTRWRDAIVCLPAGVQPVAVIYADHENAISPTPDDILREAKAAGCAAILVDTFDKSRGGLLDYLTKSDITTIVEACRRDGLVCVLAGSLTSESIKQLLPLAPDFVGVRGAACAGSRTGRLDLGRVKSLTRLVHSATPQMATARA